MNNSRRNFIKTTGLASFMLSPTIQFIAKALGITIEEAEKKLSFTFHLFRHKDLLDLHFSFINLFPDKTTFVDGKDPEIKNRYKSFKDIPKYLSKNPHDSSNSFMIVRLPQQHITEELLTESEFETLRNNDPSFIVNSYISGYSYLVFKVDLFKDILPFSISNILNWNLVDDNSNHKYFSLMTGETLSAEWQPKSYPLSINTVNNQKNLFSVFEIPYKLFITPYKNDDKGNNLGLRFSTNSLKGSRNIYELWNHRLFSQDIYSPSFKAIGYIESINEENKALVQLRREFLSKTQNRKDIVQKSIIGYNHRTRANGFLITSFGISTKLRYIDPGCENINIPDEEPVDPDAIIVGECNPNPINDLVEWKQNINLGRDEFIKFAYIGRLYPQGHRVLKVQIGRRKNVNGISYIEYKEFIQRLNPLVTYRDNEEENFLSNNEKNIHLYDSATGKYKYGNPDDIAAKKRSTPFKTLELKTVISPPIAIIGTAGNDYELFIQKLQDKFQVGKEYAVLITDYVQTLKNKYTSFKSILAADTPGKYAAEITQFESNILSKVNSFAYSSKDSFTEFLFYFNSLLDLVNSIIRLEPIILARFSTDYEDLEKVSEVINNAQRDFQSGFIDKIEKTISGSKELLGFWPKLEKDFNTTVNFEYVGIDWEGNQISLKAPAIFIPDSNLNGQAIELEVRKEVYNNYLHYSSKTRREIDIAGQKVAFFKKEIGNGIESKISELETQTIEFAGAVYLNADQTINTAFDSFKKDFPFYPEMRAAVGQLTVIKEVIKNPKGIILTYAESFLYEGIDREKKNLEGILLKVQAEGNVIKNNIVEYAKGQVENIFSNVSEQLVGIASPEMVIKALSVYENAYSLYNEYDQTRREVIGVIKVVDNLRQLNLKDLAKEAFKEAKLFGVLYLKELFKDELENFETLKDNLPISEIKDLISVKQRQIHYKWQSKEGDITSQGPLGVVNFIATNDSRNPKHFITTLALEYNSIIDYSNPSNLKITYSSTTSLNKFGLGIVFGSENFIVIYFESVYFTSSSNEKADVKVNISNIEFSEILQLLKQLQSTIGTLGKGFDFNIDFEKISLGYQFALPAISTGAFNLTNLSIGFEFNLYFKNKPLSLTFKFADKDLPCLLSIAIYGGRIYLGITVSGSGIIEMEGLIEFGGVLAVSISGIAKGIVYLFAGLYYKQEKNSATIIGYVTCGGLLSVLGIIEVSLVFYMGMIYKSGGSLKGFASVTVKIRLGFFKIEKELQTEKTISGGGVDGNFKNLTEPLNGSVYNGTVTMDVPDSTLIYARDIARSQWEEYAEAFN